MSDLSSDSFGPEPRWPMALTVLVTVALTLLVPHPNSTYLVYLFCTLEVLLLLALIAGDPGRIDRRSDALRVVSIVLVAVLVISALFATGDLVYHLIKGGPVANSPEVLLQAGGTVWVLNVVAFSFLYWELDGGGAALREHQPERLADFAFPQQMNPELAPPGWRPRFIDYMYLGFTSSTAFSPTDAMPLTPRVKIAMAVQASISLVVVALVISRAVNVFT